MKDNTSKELIAERSIRTLTDNGDLKKLAVKESLQIGSFYETKALNRIHSAKLIRDASSQSTGSAPYTDYSEAVSASYYAMYYIVHAYLALVYKTKLRGDIRGVHAITHHIVIYYLVMTKKLARHLYEEYLNALETTSTIQNITLEDFQTQAHEIAEHYDHTRHAREIFTYNTTPNIEIHHADRAIATAEEFINILRQLMRQST